MSAWLHNCEAGIQLLLADLKSSSKARNLDKGKQVHIQAIECGHDRNIYVANALINMYGKCGSVAGAREVFDSIKHPTVVSWTVLIFGYAENGQGHIALELFTRMRREDHAPNSVTLIAALKACTSVALKGGSTQWAECSITGKVLQNIAVDTTCSSDPYLQSTLLDLYAKCGSMTDARQLFESMKHPDVVSWNALILGYADNGQNHSALGVFLRMKTEGPPPDSVTIVASLRACTAIAVKERGQEYRDRGKELHSLAVENGCHSSISVQSSLLDMYAKLHSMFSAREVFDYMKQPDVLSWTVLILGYAESGQGETALDMFSRMRIQGVVPDSVTLMATLKACSSLAVHRGWAECNRWAKQIHNLAIQVGCSTEAYFEITLIDAYAKCGGMTDARKVFDDMKHRNVMAWTALMLGYAEIGQGLIVLEMFTRMRTEGPPPDSEIFVAALKGCTSVSKEDRQLSECWGKEIHNLAVENGCDSDVYVRSTLIDMYAKCGSMLSSRDVFDGAKHADVVCWTTLILGYARHGQGDISLDLFTSMGRQGPAPNSVTLVAALKACNSLAVKGCEEFMNRGKQLHSFAIQSGFNLDVYVQSTLIDMYAKCRNMVNAREVFDNMKHLDVVSWNALILGYADNGQGHIALDMFTRMRIEGPAPNSVTFGAALKASGLMGALEFGRTIHSEIDCGNHINVVLLNCLVDFYAKCGSLVEAKSVFDFHPEIRNAITWTALLAGFSSSGDYEAVFGLFNGMQDAGFGPDGVTFLCVLMCCNHAGLVVKGKECFDAMSTKHCVVPSIEHYTCMIDIFGRANKLDEAMALINHMPCSPNDFTWMTVLGACCKWKNVEIGRQAFQSLTDINDRSRAAYILMGRIYGINGRLVQQQKDGGVPHSPSHSTQQNGVDKW